MRDSRARRSLEVWLTRVADYRRSLDDLLDPQELERAARFRLPDDRARFVVGASLSRLVIGDRLGIPPRYVVLDRRCGRCGQPHGKPSTNGVEFSVSHGGGFVLVALSRVPVGIDIEEIAHGADVEDLLDIALTDAERRWIRSQPAELHARGFTSLWVRKEAVLKATGYGLTHPPSSLDVVGDATRRTRVCVVAGRRLVVQDLPAIDSRHVAAVAVLASEIPEVQMYSGSEALMRWWSTNRGR